CAVSADGRYFRQSQLPEGSPRMFATIATSLLDELLAPPEGDLAINVDVQVNVGGQPVATLPGPPPHGQRLTNRFPAPPRALAAPRASGPAAARGSAAPGNFASGLDGATAPTSGLTPGFGGLVAAPGGVNSVTAIAPPPLDLFRDRTLLEIGPMLSPLSAG